VPFTEAFSEQSPEQYVSDFMVAKFCPHTIIIGYDHHFGKERKGNYQLLKERASRYNYRLVEIPKHVLDESAISSTAIRQALLNSDVEAANKLLGYYFFFEGIVVKGDQLGRTLGYPTANLVYTDEDKIRLGEGVYAVHAEHAGMINKGMMSIGKRPTLNDSSEKVEVHLFDFNGNLYEATLKVTVHRYLRGQQKFDSLDELKFQLDLDKEDSTRILSEKWV
ncbi:MAG TPA: riboflavin biosynthesis protein RibF, partial [Chitinophagaceae bacterium]|nr:riboflavin biosynthesis protein RibF [Chitinophagaceae bacterium]